MIITEDYSIKLAFQGIQEYPATDILNLKAGKMKTSFRFQLCEVLDKVSFASSDRKLKKIISKPDDNKIDIEEEKNNIRGWL